MIGITAILMIHCFFFFFFSILVTSKYWSLFLLSLTFTQWFAGTTKSTVQQVLLFFVITRSGRLAEIRWSVCISKSKIISRVSFYQTDSDLCIYHLVILSIFNFLYNSQCIIFLTQSCQVLYSFCVCFPCSFIMGWFILSLLPHNLILQFCCILSISVSI